MNAKFCKKHLSNLLQMTHVECCLNDALKEQAPNQRSSTIVLLMVDQCSPEGFYCCEESVVLQHESGAPNNQYRNSKKRFTQMYPPGKESISHLWTKQIIFPASFTGHTLPKFNSKSPVLAMMLGSELATFLLGPGRVFRGFNFWELL